MSDYFRWVKLFIENPKVVVALYLFFSAVIGVGGFDLYDKTKRLEPQTIVIEQDNKCYECVDLLNKYNALSEQLKGISERYNKTVRDFHGGR